MLREQNTKLTIILKPIAAILLIAFLAQDIVWAYPESQPNNKLAVTGLQNPETLHRLKTTMTSAKDPERPFYSAESVYKDYFETIFEFNIRLFVLLAQRMKARRSNDQAASDRIRADIEHCAGQIISEITKFEERLKDLQPDAQAIQSHRLAKAQFIKAEELIKRNNEPAANAALVGALNIISLGRERILKKRLVSTRRNVRVAEEGHKIVMWQQVYTRKDKGSKTLMPIYAKRSFDLRWLAGNSLDRQQESNLDEHDKMADYVTRIESDQSTAEANPSGLNASNVDHILQGLSGVQVEEKRLARIVLEAVKELVEMDEAGSVKYLLPVAKRYLYLRVEDINNILYYIQTARAKPFRVLVAKRNGNFMSRVADIKDMIHKFKYEEARGSAYGLLKAVKPYLAEPELEGLEDMLWPVINELNILKGKESRVAKFKAMLWLDKVGNKLNDSQLLNEFMEAFGTEYVRRRLEMSPVRSREDTFIDVFEKFAKHKNLARGEPRANALQILCYMAVFVSLEIDNPAKPSKRISNPVFKAINALRLIVEVDHIKTISDIKRLKGLKSTIDLLNGLEASSIYKLPLEERKQLVRAMAEDFGLTDQQRFELAKAFAINRENLRRTYESVKDRPVRSEPLPAAEELAGQIQKMISQKPVVAGRDGREYMLKPVMGETNDGWAMEVFIYPIEAVLDTEFLGSIRLTVVDAATIMIHNADIRNEADRGQGIFTHILNAINEASDDRVGLMLYKVEQIDTLIAATRLLPARYLNSSISLILERADEKGIEAIKNYYKFLHDNLADAMSKGAQIDSNALASTPLMRVLNKAGYDAKLVLEKAEKWDDIKRVVNIRAVKSRRSEGAPSRSPGAAAPNEKAEKIKQRLAEWHTEYTRLVNEARKKWLEAYPDNRGRKMVRISLRLPKETLQELDKLDMEMVAKPGEGKIAITKGDNSYEASLDNRLDIQNYTQAEKIAVLAGLPKLMPGEKSMENAAAKTRRYFSWWRESLRDFEIRVNWSSDLATETPVDQLEVASIYLSQEGGMIYVEQFITNPGFRLTGIGGQFIRRAFLQLKEYGTVRSSILRPAWFAEGAREFLGYLQRIGFIVGPFVDKEGEYWFLGKEVTGKDIELPYDHLDEENPFLKASEKLLQAMVPPAQDNPLTKAFDRVGEAIEMTMRSAGISQYCTYIPHMDEFGEYIFPEDANKEKGLPHIQWVTSSAAGVALKSRHTSPRPLTGEKLIFEHLARGELGADDFNTLASGSAHFDGDLGILRISDRRDLIKRLMSSEEETAIIDRDYKDIGAAANAITYQAIYAPTLKEGDRPRLLGMQWFMGGLTDLQTAATRSFVLQAGYALERIYLLHSLEARRREIESADARLSRMKQIIANIESLGVAFHDLKNKMIPAAAFYRRLVKAGKIPEKDEERARTTIERRVEVVMNGLKESQLKITELQGHLPPAAVTRSTLILSNVNLAAALIQASSQPQLSNVYDHYLGATFPTPEERALVNASFESLNSLSELSTLTGDLESVYEQTNRIFTAILGHLNEVLPQLEEYAAFPLNEIERLANDENEDAKTRSAADVILKSISKMPQEIERLNNILGDMAAVEESKDVNLRQLVAEALDEVRAECETHGITLESKLAGLAEQVLIHTKSDALKNFVITEVLRNAVKYMPGDKDVKKITIWAEFKDGNVLLYIQDTGRGMSPEFVQTQLFRKIGAMETLDGEDAANISRSGYGLYSAQQLMRDLGGDLYVDTELTAVGKGSTFIIRHPLAHAVPVESGSDIMIAARSLGQAMINAISPAKDIASDITSGKTLILYADDILERGAAGDMAYTLTNSQILDNSTIVIYGRNPVKARLLERIIGEAAGDKNINIVRIETEDLRGYNGFEQINAIYPDEAKELDTLLARLAAHHKISNGNILGAIKGMTGDTSIQAIKELSVEKRLPVVSFEDDKGIYSFKNALAELIAISRDDKPPANREWYRTLKPIEKENIERAYQDYRRALEVAINA